MIHQLIEHAGDLVAGRPPWTVRARCGYEEVRRAGDPFPATFTGWDSRVTCPACKPSLAGPTSPADPDGTLGSR